MPSRCTQPPALRSRVGAAPWTRWGLLVLLACAACGQSPAFPPGPVLPPPPGPPPSELRPVAEWERLFLTRWEAEHTSDFLPRSNSLDSWQFYNLGYGVDGNTAMYRATGKRQYLDRALLYVENMVANARPSSQLPGSQFQDGYLGWASDRADNRGLEVPLFETYCWRYVTRLLRLIRETPELHADPGYRAQYERLLAFSEEHIFEKWQSRGEDAYIYRSRTHLAAHWAFIAMDLSRITQDAARRARYLEVFRNINRDMPNFPSSLRGQLRSNPRAPMAYFWSDVWGSTATPGQDVAHGNGVLAFIIEARDAGMEWMDADVRALRTTFASIVWPEARRYAGFVDGSGRGSGFFSDGWVKLGRYDTGVQRRLEAHEVALGTQFYGNCALNTRLLLEGSSL